jgi:hypothetical protein
MIAATRPGKESEVVGIDGLLRLLLLLGALGGGLAALAGMLALHDLIEQGSAEDRKLVHELVHVLVVLEGGAETVV